MPDINSLIEKYGKTAIEQALGKFSHDDLVALQRKKPVCLLYTSPSPRD